MEGKSPEKKHFLDLRVPMGALFSILGILLVVYGIFSPKEIYKISHGININFYWGISLFLFGVILLIMASLYKRK
ncbi:MAG: hypothetical protein AB1410_03100 [Acidobacteriota bacterium]